MRAFEEGFGRRGGEVWGRTESTLGGSGWRFSRCVEIRECDDCAVRGRRKAGPVETQQSLWLKKIAANT